MTWNEISDLNQLI